MPLPSAILTKLPLSQVVVTVTDEATHLCSITCEQNISKEDFRRLCYATVGANATRYPIGSSRYQSHVYTAKLRYALNMGDSHSETKKAEQKPIPIRLEGAIR
jgi:hypothetical protein